MQNSTWIDLLQRMSPEQHAQLVITTNNGTEIYIQSLFRIENEYLAMRARMGGSSDLGKTYIVPFNQIHYLGFREDLKEAVVQAIFAGPNGTGERGSSPAPSANGSGGEPVATAPPENGPKVPAPLANKAALLERLRKARAMAGSTSGQQ